MLFAEHRTVPLSIDGVRKFTSLPGSSCIDFCPVNSKMYISAIMFIGEDSTFRRPSTDVQWSKPGRRGRGSLHQVEEAEETVGVLAS